MLASPGCVVKPAWIDQHCRTFELAESCAVSGVSISQWRYFPDRHLFRSADMTLLGNLRSAGGHFPFCKFMIQSVDAIALRKERRHV